jgi:hypothetical protein
MSDEKKWDIRRYRDKLVETDEVDIVGYPHDGADKKLADLETSNNTTALDEIYSIANKLDSSFDDDTAKETAREFGWTTEKRAAQEFNWTFDAYKDFSNGSHPYNRTDKTDPAVAIEFERGTQIKHRWLWMKFAICSHKRRSKGDGRLCAGVIFIPLRSKRTSLDRCARELKSSGISFILSPHLPPLYIIGVE